MSQIHPRRALWTALLAATALAVHGASVLPPANLSELALMSDSVVLAKAGGSIVESRGPLLFTVTAFGVTKSVAGALGLGEGFEVEVPGGVEKNWGWSVPGSPRFASGETYLLFLSRRQGVRWQPRMLAYGILRETVGPGGPVLRPLDEVGGLQVLRRQDGQEPEALGPYDEGALVDVLGRAASSGIPLSASGARVPESSPQTESAPAGCVFMSQNGVNIRWQVFDTGGSLSMAAQAAGDSTVPGGGTGEVQNALGAWMGIPNTSLNLLYAGPSGYTLDCSGSGSHEPPAGTNIVIFNDPCSDIPDLSSCSGTLAEGGPWFTTTTHTFDGAQWYTAVGWFVIVNNGVGPCLGETDYQLMMEHELGHGLGFGHVSDPNALMNPDCCHPMDSTDITCAQYLYPGSLPVNAPEVTGVAAASSPFRLKVYGSGFHANCQVEINGAPAPMTVYKSPSKVVAKGGGTLKAMVPAGTPVQVTVRNLDDGTLSAPFTYTR